MRLWVILVLGLCLVLGSGCGGDGSKDNEDVGPDAPGDVGGDLAVADLAAETMQDTCCADLGDPDLGVDAAEDTEAPKDTQEVTPEDVIEPEDVPVEEDVEPEVIEDVEFEVAEDVTPAEDVVPDVPPAPCELDFDCESGESCVLGVCQPFFTECSSDMDCPDGEACVEEICLGEDMSVFAGKVLFNEVLTDGNTDGDPNQDGTKDPVEDEFVELVNVSNETLDLSGWMVVESDWEEWLPRYAFAEGTMLEPKGAIVIFGGGDAPESTDAVFFAVSNAADPGIPYGLDLDDSGELVRLIDADLFTVAAFAYGDAGGTPSVSDESLTRDPDLTGSFMPHSAADGSDGTIFSPGFRVDGTAF
jgi:hypothetical protein